MRRPLGPISRTTSAASAIVLLAIALAGCGSTASGGTGSGGSTTTAKKAALISLKSSAIRGGKLPAQYTCDGANTFPPLKWGPVPTRTTELVLFALNVTTAGSNIGASSVEWAMAGISPKVHSIATSKLPAGAYLITNSDERKGYSICPPTGGAKRYAFVLYAMPPPYTVGNTITGPKLLENLAEGPPQYRAVGQGALSVTYKRK
jgi:phosphatidylethanolamine-binding protein (PEBP) family uncharacterized protein